MPDDRDDDDDDVDDDDDDVDPVPGGAPPESPMQRLRPLLARIAAEWLTFPRLRQEMLNQGAPDPVIVEPTGMDVYQAVLRLLDPARPSDQVERAYVALTHSLASNNELAFALLSLRQAAPGDWSALQSMLGAPNDVFARWYEMMDGMQRVGLTVCQVYVKTKFSGTGFLVGDRYVLTAYHCVAPLIDQGVQSAGSENELYFVFDDVVMPGKSVSVYRTVVKPARTWLLKHSLPDDQEDRAFMPLEEICNDRLDFALIRLAEPAGAMASKQHRSAQRKWIELGDLADAPESQTQMLIAHYPGGSDLRLAVGLFRDFAKQSRRVRYLTPAIVGSSGAPCFTVEWKPYALHNAGYPQVPVNQGVPLKLIWDAIGGAATLAAGDNPFLIPPVLPNGTFILGRLDIFREIDAILRGESSTTVMTVAGPAGSGKRFTAELVRSMLIDRGHRAFMLDAEKFGADTPEAFASRLIHEISGAPAASPQPPSPDSRQRARWISRGLSDWARGAVGAQSGPGYAPAADGASPQTWIILINCETVHFTAETHDLLVALLGDEEGNAAGPVRFMLTGYEGDLAAIAPQRVWKTWLNLISADGVLPFMQYTLAALSREEPLDLLRANATAWVSAAINFGVRTIPRLVEGLVGWRSEREAAVNAAALAEEAA